MEQPLTPRADQPLKSRNKHRLKSRGHRHIKQNKTQQTTPDPQPPRDAIPVPEARPAQGQKTDAEPIEEQKTEGPKAIGASDRLNEAHPASPTPESSTDTESEPEPPAVAPIPTQKPDTAKPEAQPPAVAPQPPEKPAEAQEEKMLPDPRSADVPEQKMPDEELACRRRLKSMGVDFEEHKPEHNLEIGCSIPYPITLKTLGKSIAIGPETELNCEMAEAAARFAANVVQPAAKEEFGADLKSISQASAFVCRPRHAGGKLSEHAFGNALDISGFTLSDGRRIGIGPAPPEKDAKFLNAVRKAACGPFKTVLGPGSDADHALHFHLDLEPRRNGGTFCQ
ncbi:extensin family protein [Mesorhizobium sanjuanii]|uniref:Extensin family protein n=1 Tax=Mesorhizobium sanjuanii TaxID=2037900 RepID=A0A2A6FIT4_9HYPH|nr:extensin family protein [Mesorhizobium sanjuanii]PDQ21662.1 extensin family protein [Mesorhizobium sanjuanii]